jgi:hypothetical protein
MLVLVNPHPIEVLGVRGRGTRSTLAPGVRGSTKSAFSLLLSTDLSTRLPENGQTPPVIYGRATSILAGDVDIISLKILSESLLGNMDTTAQKHIGVCPLKIIPGFS